MFSDDITSSDSFLDMPDSTQNLYFHLGMKADDDGFVSSPKTVMRIIRASDDDYKILVAKKFIITFDNGICVVKHWRINNQIRKDRYTETKYIDEKQTLNIKENGAYTQDKNKGLPVPKGHFTTKDMEIDDSGNQMATKRQPSIGKYSIVKDRLGKDSIDKNTYGELGEVKLTDDEYNKLIQNFGEKNTQVLIFELDTYIASKGAKYKSHYATLLNWARRKAQGQYDKQVEKETNKKKIV